MYNFVKKCITLYPKIKGSIVSLPSFLESDEELRAAIRNWFDIQTSILYSKDCLYEIIDFSSKLFNLNLKLVYIILMNLDFIFYYLYFVGWWRWRGR